MCRGTVHISPFPIVVHIYSTSIEWLRETLFAFRQWYFQVENYGAFVWQWEEIRLIFTNSPCIGY